MLFFFLIILYKIKRIRRKMDFIKKTCFPDYNKEKTHLNKKQWQSRNILLLPFRMIFLSFMIIVCLISAVFIISLSFGIILFFLLGIDMIVEDFINNFDLIKTIRLVSFFILVFCTLVSCLIPPHMFLYLSYIISA